MPRNIEIKARLDDLPAVLARAQALADGPPQELRQEDVFYPVSQGRLKLRRLGDGHAELIHYERPDQTAARASQYHRVPVADPQALDAALSAALGTSGRVAKRRWLLLKGQTRIHLDEVQGLGAFIELEVVLQPGQTDEQGQAQAEALMQALGLQDAVRVAVAYRDLLQAAGDRPGEPA